MPVLDMDTRSSLRQVRAVIFDRDGTLVQNEPYNGDPARVRLVSRAAEALAQLRGAGLKIGLTTNQAGIARGLITADQVRAVNNRLGDLVGPFDTVRVCPHDEGDRCLCRKPQPGLILAAAADLGIPPEELVMVGDLGADIGAARAAGARSILVPGPATRRLETSAVVAVATSLTAATRLVLWWARGQQ
ncbi:MAG: HAD-IIIA family hydrolase [Micromonosporaceae bacterium]|nr:HAD-IIIA family hydrolase [Micromonosporaceae bacterium]